MKVHSSGHALPRRVGAICDDAWIIRERGEALIAVLADGVGSSREGGTAAHRVVETLADHCLSRPRTWSARRALAEFTAQVNRQLHQESFERHGSAELTCTVSAVVIEGGRLYGCNVGDSPVFHLRQDRLQRLSIAHTLTQPGLDHVLTRGLGLEPEVEPHFFELELADGDLFLLCSDGITGALPETRIAELLARRALARIFVAEAFAATEEKLELRDDVSAIVLDIAERGRPAGAAAQRLEVPGVLRAGEQVDGHRLISPLANNPRVWIASDANATNVVLKFPPVEAADSETLRDAFAREAWNATRLTSPDLVRSWIPASTGVLRCYAMEFIDAPTLRAVLKKGRLSVEHACELASFLLRTNQFLVQHDLAHGDIKPENILVIRDAAGGMQFRLLDLGSAAELFSVTSRAGTPSYLAPERFRGGALSERTEIFAIGVTLYEALSQTYPYGEIERFQTPRFETTPRRLSRLNPAVPLWLESILLRALEPAAERRYQNFSEFAFDLAHPDNVASYHRKGASLLERNPVRFYQLLCASLLLLNLWLLYRLAAK